MTRERPAVLALQLGSTSLESEVRDTARRVSALGELMQCFSSSDGLTGDQVAMVTTLINDIEDGAKRAEALFDTGHRN